MSNIYLTLGAKPVTLTSGQGRGAIEVYSDGSVSKSTKLWALALLGYDDPRVEYKSWCELSDHSNVCPFTAAAHGVKCRLHPTRNKPGYCDVEYAEIGRDRYALQCVKASDMYDTLAIAKQKAQEFIQAVDDTYEIKTQNPRYDERFRWDDNEHSWLCNGIKVEAINMWTCLNDSPKWIYYRQSNP